jgi:hypothetical protein
MHLAYLPLVVKSVHFPSLAGLLAAFMAWNIVWLSVGEMKASKHEI